MCKRTFRGSVWYLCMRSGKASARARVSSCLWLAAAACLALLLCFLQQCQVYWSCSCQIPNQPAEIEFVVNKTVQ